MRGDPSSGNWRVKARSSAGPHFLRSHVRPPMQAASVRHGHASSRPLASLVRLAACTLSTISRNALVSGELWQIPVARTMTAISQTQVRRSLDVQSRKITRIHADQGGPDHADRGDHRHPDRNRIVGRPLVLTGHRGRAAPPFARQPVSFRRRRNLRISRKPQIASQFVCHLAGATGRREPAVASRAPSAWRRSRLPLSSPARRWPREPLHRTTREAQQCRCARQTNP